MNRAPLGGARSPHPPLKENPIVGFAITNGGLMANLSIEGTKFSKIDF